MPLYGRPSWWQRIQDSEAVRHFERDGSDHFPLAELQKLSEDYLEHATSPSSSPLSFRRSRVERLSTDCDLLFAVELEQLRDAFPAREFGVVSCIHLLSVIKARQLLASMKPDISRQDEFFDKRLLVYLQCLVQAKKARADHCPPPVISKPESVAATELFSIASSRNAANNRYPAVSKLLLAIGKMNEPYNDLLPDDLVRTILHRCHFQENLKEELAILVDSKAWYEALNIVVGLHRVHETESVTAINLSKAVIPNYVMWANWRPDRDRIKLWNQFVVADYRLKLSPVFALEGPDTKTRERQTLRGFSRGGFLKLFGSDPTMGQVNLERLLHGLDNSIEIGRESIELFLHLCVEPGVGEVREQELWQLEAALELRNDMSSKILKNYLRSLQGTWSDRMTAVTAVLPILDCNFNLRALYGTNLDLAKRAIRTLSDAQSELCKRLEERRSSVQLGLDVQAFGSALLRSEWLLDDRPAVIEHLKRIPPPWEVKSAFRSLETLQGPARERQVYSLVTTLCGSSLKNHQAVSVPSAAIVTFDEDPIWHEPMESSCDVLRKALSRIHETNARLATECLKQAQKEHDVIVQEIADNIHDTDQACVNITNFLGTRAAKGFPIHQCWQHLALYMMRQRPPGLLERCHLELRQAQSWVRWTSNMRRVFGEYHLTPQAGLGLSAEKIQGFTAMKSMSRSASTSTNSTGSSSI
ncbi:hypothetical protein CSOJ01_12911 [Colletotrichum sojae]|uniref:Uncharacterized protein n=1 Tax=Colletotrichum sojae TaxID=2175907 RepID=A0A8H6MLS6_9PEZI|nr:hypothetical protein CSOJ01_12911 [Colletotrichum sojae]